MVNIANDRPLWFIEETSGGYRVGNLDVGEYISTANEIKTFTNKEEFLREVKALGLQIDQETI